MTTRSIVLFSKMHGLGNDYVIIDESEEIVVPEDKKSVVVEELCRRGFSIGADGVIFISSSEIADIRFRIFNADGSEAEMCGNGIRCFAKFVYENRVVEEEEFKVETLGGIKTLTLNVEDGEVISSRVDMGLGSFLSQEIPMNTDKEEFIEEELEVNGVKFPLTAVNVGNPHAVIFTDDLEEIPLAEFGPLLENHQAFPERINVHFVRIISPSEVEMITWERGAGFTLACGTGATSVALAGYRLGQLNENVLVHLPGGDLEISVYPENGNLGAFMQGDAVMVFEGIIEVEY
ncbi:MAG TPA: diaminopimelate epimerase [Methanobacteriaceae archaeon]|nr:diaminopimelate epimerase [Methanobacteriaceae archaeon]